MEVKETPKTYDRDKPREPDREKGKGKGKGKGAAACRHFLLEMGCKKGQACSFAHEWGGGRQNGKVLLWKHSAHEAGLPGEGGPEPQGEEGELSGDGDGQVRTGGGGRGGDQGHLSPLPSVAHLRSK